VSPKEFALLRALLESRGETVSRHLLLERVWGLQFDPRTNVVEVHVARLRRKLEESRVCIETVKGRGYRLIVPRDPECPTDPTTDGQKKGPRRTSSTGA